MGYSYINFGTGTVSINEGRMYRHRPSAHFFFSVVHKLVLFNFHWPGTGTVYRFMWPFRGRMQFQKERVVIGGKR